MSHVTYECVMSRMNASCHITMSHVTCELEGVESHMGGSCQTSMRTVTHECLRAMSHVTCELE